MENAPTTDFFALAAAALTARQHATRDDEHDDQNRECSTHPMLARIGDFRVFPKEDTGGYDTLDFVARLCFRLALFRGGSLEWGLVDDWRSDGSVYKRHGIVVTLKIDMADVLTKRSVWGIEPRHVREAIDLTILAIALDANVLKHLMRKNRYRPHGKRRVNFQDEIGAVARGVPWELRLVFESYRGEFRQLKPAFQADFIEKFDEELSSNVFTQQRDELLQALTHHKATSLERIVRVAQHPIRAHLLINTMGELQTDLLVGEDFFAMVTASLADLDRYQSRSEPRMWRKHAPFHIEKLVLKLGQMHITSSSHDFAKTLLASRIPVQLAWLSLDFRLISCSEESFGKFVQTITAGATDLVVDNGDNYDDGRDFVIDAEDQDRSERIRAFIKTIAEIRSIRKLNLGGMFVMLTSLCNRDALWCGIFEDILSRDEPIKELMFRAGLMKQMTFTAIDEALLIETSPQTRNPSSQLRDVLDLDVYEGHRPIFDDDSLAVLDGALASNRTIRYIGIALPSYHPYDAATTRLIQELLHKHSGCRLLPREAETRSELPLAARVAFLSAICERDSTAARCSLDSTAISTIFAFSMPLGMRSTSADR